MGRAAPLMVVGIGGKLCAGKDTVASLFAEHGFEIIDVDSVGHQALINQKHKLVRQFGENILNNGGRINRKRLGSIVFRNKKKLRQLETIVHPYMVENVKSIVDHHPDNDYVINAALLFYMGLHKLCDVVLWVKAPWWIRLKRAKKRDGHSLWSILKRMWSQRKLKPQKSDNHVDIHIIKNGGNTKISDKLVIRIIRR